jgi:hypothetical protein
MPTWKTDCRVEEHNGLAHIVEQEYSPGFKVWYGCVDIVCDKEDMQEIVDVGNRLINRQVQMQLEDGRSMTVYISGFEILQNSVVHEGEAPSNYLGCNFVSLTPLLNPMDLLNDPRSVFPEL